MEKLLLSIDSKKSWINQHSYAHFFRVIIFAKYEFCAYLACIHFHKSCLKEILACTFCEVDQNLQNSQKYVHARISALEVLSNTKQHLKLNSRKS